MPKVKQYKKDYGGTERSPYLDYLMRKGDYNQEHEKKEPAQANGDALAETDSLYYQNREKIIESDEFQKVLKALPNLTKHQREVLQLVGYEGRSFSDAALILSKTKSSIQKTIERIRKKIK